MFETSFAIIVFVAVWGLIQVAKLLQTDEDDPTQSSIASGLKIYLMVIVMLLLIGGLVSVPNIIESSNCEVVKINETTIFNVTTSEYAKQCFTPTNTTSSNNVKTVSRAMYRGAIFTFIPFIFFLLILLLHFIMMFMTRIKK